MWIAEVIHTLKVDNFKIILQHLYDGKTWMISCEGLSLHRCVLYSTDVNDAKKEALEFCKARALQITQSLTRLE